jgi:hypothetical protein
LRASLEKWSPSGVAASGVRCFLVGLVVPT